MLSQHSQQYKIASRGAILGIIIYLLLSSMKLTTGYLFHSVSLQADGWNNLSDIVTSLSVYIGLKIASRPADDNHTFGHSKFESIASFITSVLMFTIGIDVFKSGIERLISQSYDTTNIKAIYISLISMVILWFSSYYLQRLASKTQSIGLKATASDMKNDFLISTGTLIGTLFVHWGYPFVDVIISIIVSLLIIYSAITIFKESTFLLSDGFDQDTLMKYKKSILRHPHVHHIPNIRARLSGNQIYVDVTIEIDGNLSVTESHKITQDIEKILSYNYNVHDCDVHVEPYQSEIQQK